MGLGFSQTTVRWKKEAYDVRTYFNVNTSPWYHQSEVRKYHVVTYLEVVHKWYGYCTTYFLAAAGNLTNYSIDVVWKIRKSIFDKKFREINTEKYLNFWNVLGLVTRDEVLSKWYLNATYYDLIYSKYLSLYGILHQVKRGIGSKGGKSCAHSILQL